MFEESVSNIPSIWASMNSWFTPTVLFVVLNVMIATIAFTSTLANNQKQNQNQNQNQNQHKNDDSQHYQQPTIARSPSVLQRLRSINLYGYRSQEPIPSPPVSTHFVASSPDLYTHHQQQTLLQPDTHFDFQKTLESQILETQTHFDFQLTHDSQIQETQTHFNFQQTHDDSLDSQTRFDFQQILKSQTHFDSQQTHDSQILKPQTHFDFKQTQFEEGAGEENPQSMDEIYSLLTDRHVSRTVSDTHPSAGEIPAKLPTKMKKSASSKSAFAHFEEEKIVETRRPATVREGKARVTEEDDDEVDAKADDFINKFKQQLKLQRMDSIVRYKDMIKRGSNNNNGK